MHTARLIIRNRSSTPETLTTTDLHLADPQPFLTSHPAYGSEPFGTVMTPADPQP
jgi:hypothetical protein